jgi:hypothetical protein|nr:MAG TPA: hypothetical protein [Caudoviricetes sp.]
MKKVKTVLKYIAVTLLILVVAQAAKQIGRAAAQPVDNPPQHVQEERAIQRARLDIHYHNDTKEQMMQDNEYTDNGWCKQYGCGD